MAITSILQSKKTRIGKGLIAANFSNTSTGTYTSSGINYKYVTFTANGTLTITSAGFADILIVGGGGSGYNTGDDYAGGGAGGVYYDENFFLDAIAYTITIGAGGTYGSNPANNGGTSSIGTAAKIGGGMGGYADSGYPRNGISGFGGGGCAGGFASSDTGSTVGSGAGAGGTVFGSNNRDGRSISITGSAVTYGTGGPGGSTGNGAANTGNGGGYNGAGGSGIVIVRVRT